MNRRQKFLEFFAKQDITGYPLCQDSDQPRFAVRSVFFELPKLELMDQGQKTLPINDENIRRSMQFIWERNDCADFTFHAFLRMIYRYGDSPVLSLEFKENIPKLIKGFTYWMDEPIIGEMCYFTENHQILFHVAELLAGQLYPDAIFTNRGKSGRWHYEHAIPFIERWLDWRIRFGFSEWLSNSYYDMDLLALVNLADYADIAAFKKQATMLIDLMLYEIALHSHKGIFGSTKGRGYSRDIITPEQEYTGPIAKLMWNRGCLEETLSTAAMLFSTSDYELPDVIYEIAHDQPESLESLSRHSLDVDEAPAYGVFPDKKEHAMFFWGAQQFHHRRTIDVSLEICKPEYSMYQEINKQARKYKFCEENGLAYEPDINHTALTKVNTYTYRTPHCMLSCAQDYRKGKDGMQQHIWQATLAERAIVFSNHPGTAELRGRPSYWQGNGTLPKAVAYKNVLVCLHKIPDSNRTVGKWNRWDQKEMFFSHAYFPQSEFDEVVEKGAWVFGRKAEAYIGLYSMLPTVWNEPQGDLDAVGDAAQPYDLVAQGLENVWICELGDSSMSGSFADFVGNLAKSSIKGDLNYLEYYSPSQGKIETGWDHSLVVRSEVLLTSDYPRFDSPYCQADFNTYQYEIKHGSKKLRLDFEKSVRLFD